jgi:hypothetical protein
MPSMKRTEAQLNFDLAVKGWAFRSRAALKKELPYYQKLYDALGETDQQRLDLLHTIQGAAQGIPL